MGWKPTGPIFRVKTPKRTAYYTPCVCDCGKTHDVECSSTGKLSSRGCKSCCNGRLKHGQAKAGAHSADYNMWSRMMARCYNKNNPKYAIYGCRGIVVAERWHDSAAFLADIQTEMGPKPSPKHSIDRIDVNGNYGPGNVRWATPKEQSRNLRKNRIVEANGRSMCVSAWAEALGVAPTLIWNRLNRGWSDADSVTVPFESHKQLILEYRGVKRSVAEWANITGTPWSRIHHRLRRKWSVGQAIELDPPPVRPRGKGAKGKGVGCSYANLESPDGVTRKE